MSKRFHISDILSIHTGMLVSTRHMEGVYEILNFLLSDDFFTHQLPRAAAQAQPDLLRQLPWLSEIKYEHIDFHDLATRNGVEVQQEIDMWLNDLIIAYGEWHDLEPSPDPPARVNPLTELAQMIRPDQEIVVVSEESKN